MRPTGVEFTALTKHTALLRDNHVCAVCEMTDLPDDPWEFHHIIWVDWGIRHGIPHAVLRHLSNCRPLHKTCHEYLHNEYDEPLDREVEFILSQLGIQLSLWADTN